MNTLYNIYKSVPPIEPDKEVIKLAYITIKNNKSPIVDSKELLSYLKYVMTSNSSQYDEVGAQIIYCLSSIYHTNIMEVIGGK